MAGLEGTCERQAELTFAMARHAVVDLSLVFRTNPRKPSHDRLPPEKLAEKDPNQYIQSQARNVLAQQSGIQVRA